MADAAQHPGAVHSPMVGTAYLASEPGASVALGAKKQPFWKRAMGSNGQADKTLTASPSMRRLSWAEIASRIIVQMPLRLSNQR